MRHLVAAEDYDRAAALLAEHGGRLDAGGALTSLVSIAQAFARRESQAHPRRLAYRAEVSRLRAITMRLPRSIIAL